LATTKYSSTIKFYKDILP
jgi:Tubulin-tyrosine ligase family